LIVLVFVFRELPRENQTSPKLLFVPRHLSSNSILALQARRSEAQGGGARTAGSGTLGFRMELRFSPERAAQAFA
jgi:hypothetical protein